jgi:hypothetical protein
VSYDQHELPVPDGVSDDVSEDDGLARSGRRDDDDSPLARRDSRL